MVLPSVAVQRIENSSLWLQVAWLPICMVVGLVGEAGDVADSVTEVLRARDGCCDADAKAQIARELGDVMWHTAAIAEALGYSLEDVARMNLEQLGERSASGAIRDGGAQRWR